MELDAADLPQPSRAMGCPACGGTDLVEASDGRICCAICAEVVDDTVQLVDDTTDAFNGVFQPVNEHLGLGAAAASKLKRRLFPERDAALNASIGALRRGVEEVCSAARMPRGSGADSARGEVVDLVTRYFK